MTLGPLGEREEGGGGLASDTSRLCSISLFLEKVLMHPLKSLPPSRHLHLVSAQAGGATVSLCCLCVQQSQTTEASFGPNLGAFSASSASSISRGWCILLVPPFPRPELLTHPSMLWAIVDRTLHGNL